MDDKLLHEWARFIHGKWQRERPTAPGTYYVATRTGSILNNTRKVSLDGEKDEVTGPAWAGWWWSAPIPRLPIPPHWRED